VKKCEKTKIYYLLFNLIRRNPYVKGKEIALVLGRSGRGVTISSALRQLVNMYKEKISYRPRLVLNNYLGFETTAFLCKKSGKYGCTNIYWKLYKKKLSSEISSAFYLAGNYDFFVTTRKSSVDLESIGLGVSETTKFFDPIYTIPKGWNHPTKKCIRDFINEKFVKKKLPRNIKQDLNWDDVDWRIYRSIRENLRKPLEQVSREIGESPYIIKKRLHQVVIPSCTIANFFFPLGYDYYDKIFLHLDSEYESSIVKALRKLPCTSYVYPLEKKMVCVLFYDEIRYVLMLTRKMEEKDLTKDILLSVPLASIF
jgi:DNA-binding Lrp family transcriptional regulator